MPDLYVFFIVGAVFLSVGVVAMYSGRVWVRFNGWVYRDKEPRTFWGEVVAYSLVGVAFVAGGVIYAFSH
jgi:hypothetical protein